jgi:hypothetical protein
MTLQEIRTLAKDVHGAGLNEPDRAKLRAELTLSEIDIPKRAFLGFRWRGSQ